jgi:8-oxo-dGTP pyrophosphatase MutT (NUDIX family)
MPEAVVGVIHDAGRFLLIRRADGIPAGGWWTPPSGRVEPGETQPEALVREMREELGLEVTPLRQLWTCPTADGRFTLSWWLAETDDLTTTPDPAEVAEVRWCSVDELLELSPTFADDVRFFVEVWPTIAEGERPGPGGA